MVLSSLSALSRYAGMEPEDLRKGSTPAELAHEARHLAEVATLLERLEGFLRGLSTGKRLPLHFRSTRPGRLDEDYL